MQVCKKWQTYVSNLYQSIPEASITEYVQLYNIRRFSNMEMNIKLLIINKNFLYFVFKEGKFQNDTRVLEAKNNVFLKMHSGTELHLKRRVL